jgi:hypothetical protein
MPRRISYSDVLPAYYVTDDDSVIIYSHTNEEFDDDTEDDMLLPTDTATSISLSVPRQVSLLPEDFIDLANDKPDNEPHISLISDA